MWVVFFPEDTLADFVLHRASEKDAHSIKKLINLVGINPMGLDWHRFIVAETPNGKFAGCGQLKPHSDGTLELASLAVIPAARNQGLGGIIIRQLLSEAGRPLYLTCRAQLETYYQQFGFRIISGAELPKYFRRISRIAGLINALHIINVQMRVMILD